MMVWVEFDVNLKAIEVAARSFVVFGWGMLLYLFLLAFMLCLGDGLGGVWCETESK